MLWAKYSKVVRCMNVFGYLTELASFTLNCLLHVLVKPPFFFWLRDNISPVKTVQHLDY